MKKRIIFFMLSTVMTMMLSGCSLLEDLENPVSPEMEVTAVEEKEEDLENPVSPEMEVTTVEEKEEDLENSVSPEMEVTTVEEKENEIEILSYSHDSSVTTAILLDNKENILYGLVKVKLNNAGSAPGEIFMLVDPEGNPYVYDGNAEHIPELVLHKEESESEAYLNTYVFLDSVYNIRYALLFTKNNSAGAHTGNVITLLNEEGKPSTYK